MADNKIKYGLRNVYIAACTETLAEGTGEYSYSYGTPKRLPGAVSLNLDPSGDKTEFYADDVEYFVLDANNGYDGSIEIANTPDWFRTEFLGDLLDDGGALVESAEVVDHKPFAMMFEFQGDVNATRHCMYFCKASRMSVASSTKEKSIEPNTDTLSLTATPRKDKGMYVKAKAKATDSAYATWFTSVHEPVIAD